MQKKSLRKMAGVMATITVMLGGIGSTPVSASKSADLNGEVKVVCSSSITTNTGVAYTKALPDRAEELRVESVYKYIHKTSGSISEKKASAKGEVIAQVNFTCASTHASVHIASKHYACNSGSKYNCNTSDYNN